MFKVELVANDETDGLLSCTAPRGGQEGPLKRAKVAVKHSTSLEAR